MTIFIAALLTLFTLFVIIYPFFKQKWSPSFEEEDGKFRELHSRRDTTYSMLKELEFDYQSGILTEEDYRDLEARYKRKAISILKDADELEKGVEPGEARTAGRKIRQVKQSSADKSVEEEILKLRKSKGGDAGTAVEKEVVRLRKSQAKFCPKCGTKSQEDDRFCASCGAKLI